MSVRARVIVAISLCLVAGPVAVQVVPKLRMRRQLVGMKLRGQLVDLEWREVIRLLGSRWGAGDYDMAKLLATGNPHLAARNRYGSPADVGAGREIFRSKCAVCHGLDGRGSDALPRSLAELRHGSSNLALFRTIAKGIPGTPMKGFDLPPESIWRLVSFVGSLANDTKPSQEAVLPSPDVTFERLVTARDRPENWLMYGGAFDGRRFSTLDEIRPSNVADLKLKWAYQMESADTKVETTPLVVQGVMYLTEPPNDVVALDTESGRELWRFTRPIPAGIAFCCGRINRGVAILRDTLYVGTLDAYLVAIDARTGRKRWEVPVADYRSGYSMKSPPLALENSIVTGVAGGEFGVRGFVDAYDPNSGTRLWRFYTIPGPGEPGNETWGGTTWRTGGAATWVTGSFDPGLGLLYWTTGNPAPLFSGGERPGDNLHSNSIIALDPASGRLKWSFQITPHDEHDWDANATPVLVDSPSIAGFDKVLLLANKNAFLYVLDRRTGRFLRASEFARQTWAERIDADGKPVPKPNISPTSSGTLVYPGVGGATNWWPPSYSETTGLLYVLVSDWGSVYFKRPGPRVDPRDFFGSATQQPAQLRRVTSLRALAAATGAIAWEHRFSKTTAGPLGGILSTGGSLVFAGVGDEFVALDARSGAKLWQTYAGAEITAPPIAYVASGRQQVTVAASRTVFTFSLAGAQEEPKTRSTPIPATGR